jgi:tetratricopeptide (TPR) repeat protein
MKKAWTWKNVELSPELSAKLQQEFEVSFFQRALEHDPENVDILVFLGDAFSKRGMVLDGLEIDKRLVRICPEEPTFYYNLACSYSLLGDVDPAFKALQKAIQLGYQNFEHLQKDADLDNLRKDRRFIELMKGFATQS